MYVCMYMYIYIYINIYIDINVGPVSLQSGFRVNVGFVVRGSSTSKRGEHRYGEDADIVLQSIKPCDHIISIVTVSILSHTIVSIMIRRVYL